MVIHRVQRGEKHLLVGYRFVVFIVTIIVTIGLVLLPLTLLFYGSSTQGKRWATPISSSCRGGCSLNRVLNSDSILPCTAPSLHSGRLCILIESLLPHCSMSANFASKVSTCLQSLFMMTFFYSKSRFWDWVIKVCSWIASVTLSKVGFKTFNNISVVPS